MSSVPSFPARRIAPAGAPSAGDLFAFTVGLVRAQAETMAASEPEPAGDMESDPADWPDWTDQRWTLATDAAVPVNGARLTLAEWIDSEAERYRELDSEAGALVAETLAELATEARLVHADSAETLRERRAALLADRHADMAAAWDALERQHLAERLADDLEHSGH